MRKVILDFENLYSRDAIHEYIAQQMQFPHYYGRNLDALFDCLTDIDQPTAIGCYFPEPAAFLSEEEQEMVSMNRMGEYLEKLRETFLDAEDENQNLAVFLGRK